MKRGLSLLVAAAIAGGTVAGFSSAEAAAPRIAPAVSTNVDSSSAIVQVREGHRKWRRGRHHSHYKHRHRHRHHGSFPYFAFSFPFVAPYAYYNYAPRCYGQVFRGHDGRLYCRVY
jgi:hypothetical protein